MSTKVADTGTELARLRTVKSIHSGNIVLYERAVKVGRKSVPVKGCTITLGKPSKGESVAAALAFGPAGLAVMRTRDKVFINSTDGTSLYAYCYGRDASQIRDFMQAVAAQAALYPAPAPGDTSGTWGMVKPVNSWSRSRRITTSAGSTQQQQSRDGLDDAESARLVCV
jgi:hypothetical protein